MNNTSLTICLTAALIAGMASQSVAAGGDHKGPRHSFEELDLNSDGQISPEEMAQHKEARFKKTDANGDGKLSKEEVTARFEGKQAARRDRMVNHMFKKRDADGDGMISLAEMQSGRSGKMFSKADKNDDGLINPEEFEAMKQKMREKHGKKEG